MEFVRRIRVVDSHTGGEPTRVVIDGGPDLGHGPMSERRAIFRERHDDLRATVVNEPRGSDPVVGALLCEPCDPTCAAGVIFFNNVGTIGMCVHGSMGVAKTLAHLGRISAGSHRLETPVGVVTIELTEDGRVTVDNVPSYRHAQGVVIQVPAYGEVMGDVAWGGNWFYLVDRHPEQLDFANVERLSRVCWQIRQALASEGVTGTDGAEIDHIELFSPATTPDADSKNFVLCPGRAYDRSPCGTGTSAKLACLIADGKLKPGQVWRQASIVGSVFEGTAMVAGNRVLPRIKGTAYITAETTLLVERGDPFAAGIHI